MNEYLPEADSYWLPWPDGAANCTFYGCYKVWDDETTYTIEDDVKTIPCAVEVGMLCMYILLQYSPIMPILR